VVEPFLVGSASGTGEHRVFVELGGVGCEVAFGGAHLGDPPGHELPQAHKGVWEQVGGDGRSTGRRGRWKPNRWAACRWPWLGGRGMCVS